MYQRILFWDSHEQKRLNTLPCVDQMPKFTHTCIPNDVTAKCMFVFGSSSKVESWCHSGASTTPVNTHMVNWWCDAMRDRERESTTSMRETEREVAHGMKPLARNRRRWCKRNWRVCMTVPFYQPLFLVTSHSYTLSWTPTLVPHQLVQQEGVSNPKKHHAPCRS